VTRRQPGADRSVAVRRPGVTGVERRSVATADTGDEHCIFPQDHAIAFAVSYFP